VGGNSSSSILLYQTWQSRAIWRLVHWLNYRFMSNLTQNRSQATVNVYSKFPAILNGHVVFEICERTGRHTHIFITILCIPIRGKVIKNQQVTGRLQNLPECHNKASCLISLTMIRPKVHVLTQNGFYWQFLIFTYVSQSDGARKIWRPAWLTRSHIRDESFHTISWQPLRATKRRYAVTNERTASKRLLGSSTYWGAMTMSPPRAVWIASSSSSGITGMSAKYAKRYTGQCKKTGH